VVWLCRIGKRLDQQIYVLRRWLAGPVCGEYVCSIPVRLIDHNINELVNSHNNNNNYNVIISQFKIRSFDSDPLTTPEPPVTEMNDNDVIEMVQHVKRGKEEEEKEEGRALCSCERAYIAELPMTWPRNIIEKNGAAANNNNNNNNNGDNSDDVDVDDHPNRQQHRQRAYRLGTPYVPIWHPDLPSSLQPVSIEHYNNTHNHIYRDVCTNDITIHENYYM
jgi:hypothetical protein